MKMTVERWNEESKKRKTTLEENKRTLKEIRRILNIVGSHLKSINTDIIEISEEKKVLPGLHLRFAKAQKDLSLIQNKPELSRETLSTRAYNATLNMGAESINDICRMSTYQFLKTKYMGRKTAIEIIELMERSSVNT